VRMFNGNSLYSCAGMQSGLTFALSGRRRRSALERGVRLATHGGSPLTLQPEQGSRLTMQPSKR